MTDPLPRYYAVDGRPVALVATPGGGAEALAVDATTGGLFPDPSFLGRVGATVAATGAGEGVERLTEGAFARLVAARRRPIADRLRASAIVWESTGGGEVPYRARAGERTLTVRVNDFPAEPLYTLLVDGQAVDDLEDWPAAWARPARSEALPDAPGPTERRD
jgi:hypothetical protein